MTTFLDFTGTDPRFKVEDQRINIWPIEGNSFVINLVRPAYEDTLVIYNTETLPYIALNKGIDWVIRQSDIDYNAMGKARLADPNFTKTLIKSVTVVLIPDPDMNVSLVYNTLEMSEVDYNALDPETTDITPEFMYEVARDIAYLRDSKNPIEDLLSESIGSTPSMDVDLTGTSPTNLVEGEIHTLNAQANRIYIRPIAGAFYKDSVQIRLNSTNTLLVPNVDYRVICCNTNKTSQTSNISGVYDVIIVTAGVIGNVTIRYQAFGGDVSRQDINTIYKALINVVQYINNASFLTSDTVGGSSVFIKLIQRLGELEETVRILSTGGTPTYADSTNGKAFLHRFASPDSVNKHWYTIAKLRTVAGSGTVYTKNQCRYKILCSQSGLMFDVIISADIDNKVNPLTIKVLSSNDKDNYVPYTSYNNVANIIQPEFRLIWNEEVDIRSGAFLQIGFNLKFVGVETMGLEDWSGAESCWIATTPPPTAVIPADDLITLPDGVSIWSAGSGASKSAIATYTPNRGVLAWAGSVNLNTTTATPVALALITTPVDITYMNVKKVTFHIWDRIAGRMIVHDAKVVPFSTGLKCSVMFFPEDLSSIAFTLTKVGNVFTSSIISILGNYSKDVFAFEIREITFEF